MLNGEIVVAALKSSRESGADRNELLREAVRLIESSEERFHWVGVYELERPVGPGPNAGDDELVLHNYMGRPTDHMRIRVGVGVCGAAVAEERDMNVPDVRALDNYLACSLETRSELVVLIRDPASGEIYGQLDLDSDQRAAFTEEDERELKTVAKWLTQLFSLRNQA